MMPKRGRTRDQNRAAAITAERSANHRSRDTPADPPYRRDEHFEYDDTFTEAPIPPPF